MGVAPRPQLPRLRTSDLSGTSFPPSALPVDVGTLQPRNDGTPTSLESLLRRFAEGGMAEETLRLVLVAKIKEDERNAAGDNLRLEQLRTARILAMHDQQEYAYDHRSPLSPPSTTHSASPWTKYDRNPLSHPQSLASSQHFPVAGPSSVPPRYRRAPLLLPVPPPAVLPPNHSLSTPISPSNSSASAGTTKSKGKRKTVGSEERPLKEVKKEEEPPKPIHDHATVMHALKARVLRNQEATRIAALNAPPLDNVKPAKRRKLSPATKSTPRVAKSKSPSTSVKIKQESPSSAIALTVAPEERSTHHSKPSNSLQSLLNAVAVSPFVVTGYATSDMRSS